MQDELFVYPHNVRTEFLIKIFGDRSKEGLIDSDSVKDCDARLMSLKSSWDDKEIKHSRKETPNSIVTSLPTFPWTQKRRCYSR